MMSCLCLRTITGSQGIISVHRSNTGKKTLSPFSQSSTQLLFNVAFLSLFSVYESL
uniref:Uncharacterized protein n=1 Tax=Paramormyrops kingsleyae TaxID=1676925 RepID=A0A3B3RG95_9TELE